MGALFGLSTGSGEPARGWMPSGLTAQRTCDAGKLALEAKKKKECLSHPARWSQFR